MSTPERKLKRPPMPGAGRPPLPAGAGRKCRMEIRLNADEHRRFHAAAREMEMDFGAWCRLALHEQSIRKTKRKGDK